MHPLALATGYYNIECSVEVFFTDFLMFAVLYIIQSLKGPCERDFSVTVTGTGEVSQKCVFGAPPSRAVNNTHTAATVVSPPLEEPEPCPSPSVIRSATSSVVCPPLETLRAGLRPPSREEILPARLERLTRDLGTWGFEVWVYESLRHGRTEFEEVRVYGNTELSWKDIHTIFKCVST